MRIPDQSRYPRATQVPTRCFADPLAASRPTVQDTKLLRHELMIYGSTGDCPNTGLNEPAGTGPHTKKAGQLGHVREDVV